ncbi:MAG: DNA gyrase inhibitor YacG [Burkholderiales bacterium]
MTTSSPRFVACPGCGTPVAWTPESRFRPFCSKRCKLLDLAGWANETYRIVGTSDEESPRENTD